VNHADVRVRLPAIPITGLWYFFATFTPTGHLPLILAIQPAFTGHHQRTIDMLFQIQRLGHDFNPLRNSAFRNAISAAPIPPAAPAPATFHRHADRP
jgi:hypothetical protein